MGVARVTGRQKMVIGWTALILSWVVGFAFMEGYALTHDDAITLSRYLWEANQAWPPLTFLAGMIVGGLVVHLMWPWLPNNPNDHRG